MSAVKKPENVVSMFTDVNDLVDRSRRQVWHPAIHKRFREQLYYVFLSVKPYQDSQFQSSVNELMEKSGISRWCCYNVFGNFDCILRLWLLPEDLNKFLESAQADIWGIQSIREFQVRHFHSYWLFPDMPSDEHWESLHPEVYQSLQKDDEEMVVKYANEMNALIRSNAVALASTSNSIGSDSINRNSVKAFIAVSFPNTDNAGQLSTLLTDLKNHIMSEDYKMDQVTFLSGIGFCWALAKVVCSYSDIGRITRDLSTNYNHWGISSSTFLVNEAFKNVTGESISLGALQSKIKRDPKVASFVPNLYFTPDAQLSKEQKKRKRDIEHAVSDLIDEINSGARVINRERRETLKEYFSAVINEDVDSVFMALYRPLSVIEKVLRDPISETAGRYYPSGVKGLLAEIAKSHRNEDNYSLPRNFEKVSLLDLLRATKQLATLCSPEIQLFSGMSEEEMKNIADLRNWVMHYKSKKIDLSKDWEQYLNILLKSFEIQFMLPEIRKSLSKNK